MSQALDLETACGFDGSRMRGATKKKKGQKVNIEMSFGLRSGVVCALKTEPRALFLRCVQRVCVWHDATGRNLWSLPA